MTGLASQLRKTHPAHETLRPASEPGRTTRRRTRKRQRTLDRKTNKIKLATINIATYRDKEEEIVEMMRERRIDILGMAHTRHWGRDGGRDIGGGTL